MVEAMMERRSGKPWREGRLRETCAAKRGAAEARTTAPTRRHAFRLPCRAFRLPQPRRAMPPPTPPPCMPLTTESRRRAAAEPTAVPTAAAATATATSECWWRKCKRRTERTGDETTKELVASCQFLLSNCINEHNGD